MSKSTPISQLPSNIPNSSQGDLMLDDDPTVQEVLNQFAQSASSTEQQQQYGNITPQQYVPQSIQTPQMPPQQMFNPSQNIDYVLPPPQMQYYQQSLPKSFKFDMDIKNVLLVVAIVVVVQVVPIEAFVFKYVAVEHIPYSTILIKAATAGLLYFVAQKYLRG